MTVEKYFTHRVDRSSGYGEDGRFDGVVAAKFQAKTTNQETEKRDVDHWIIVLRLHYNTGSDNIAYNGHMLVFYSRANGIEKSVKLWQYPPNQHQIHWIKKDQAYHAWFIMDFYREWDKYRQELTNKEFYTKRDQAGGLFREMVIPFDSSQTPYMKRMILNDYGDTDDCTTTKLTCRFS